MNTANTIQVTDRVRTTKGAGRILKGGLVGIVKQIDKDHAFIMIGDNGYHVKLNELIKVN